MSRATASHETIHHRCYRAHGASSQHNSSGKRAPSNGLWPSATAKSAGRDKFSDRRAQQLSALAAAIPGHDAVVSCLGQRSSSDAGLLKRSASAVLAALQNSSTRRYVVVSQGLLFPSTNPIVMVLRSILRRHVADSRSMEAVVRASDLDWTVVRPPRLTERGRSRGYRVAIDAQPRGGWSMHYGDLAICLLDIVEKRTHVQEIVGVASA